MKREDLKEFNLSDEQMCIRDSYQTTPAAWLGPRFLADAEHLQKTNPVSYTHLCRSLTTCKLSELVSPAFFDVHRQIKAGKVEELVSKGGRGSTKSSFVSIELIMLLLRHPDCHAVVLRRVNKTLRTSVYAQVCWAIGALGLSAKFKCTVSPMECTYPVSYTHLPAAPDNARIPDGKYRAICKEARLIEPSETKPMRLSCSFIIMAVSYTHLHY